MNVDGVNVYGAGAVPTDLLDQIARLQTQVYEEPSHHDPLLSPHTAALVEDGRVVAVLDILTKDVVHAGETWRASGLSWVLADPTARRRGYGARLVAAVHDDLRQQPVDLVLFTCDRELVPFYESAGFEQAAGTVLIGGTVDEPFPSDAPGFDKVTMIGLISARAIERRDAFIGCRIALYPGSIDKLW